MSLKSALMCWDFPHRIGCKMLERMKGAIFDLDGTLLDSMGVWRRIDENFLGKRGYLVPEDYLKAITAKNFKDAADYTIERFGLHERAEDIMEEWFAMAIDAYTHHVQLKPSVREYLKCLRERGVKIAAATSSDVRLFEPCLRHHGIHDWFDAFTVTTEVKRAKGFPDVYWNAAEKLGLSYEDCVVYEDILKGVEGAKMGGFYVVGVEDIHSSYEKEEIRRKADSYIVSFEELV